MIEIASTLLLWYVFVLQINDTKCFHNSRLPVYNTKTDVSTGKRSIIVPLATTTSTESTATASPNEFNWEKESWYRGWETCQNETISALEGGSIPDDIHEGTYFRNGHAKYEVGKKDKVMHPFDADGMVTSITINNGKALFRNRYVYTRGFKKELKQRKILYRGAFGTGKSGGFLSNIFDVKMKNVANTNVIYWGGRLLALWEAGLPHRLEADSLRTLGEYTFKGLLKTGDTFSAHPKVDSNTGNLVSFSSKQKLMAADITIYEFDKELNVEKSRKISIPGFVFFHDFIVTKNYYIFNKAPMNFNPAPFLLGFKGPAECIQFDSTAPATLFIVPRDGSKEVQELKVDCHFNFHFANAYEDDDGKVVYDVIWCDNMQLGANEEKKEPIWKVIDYAKDVPYSVLQRYTLTPPSASSSTWTYSKRQLSKTQLDFPIVSSKVACSKHRYIYGSCGSDMNKSTPVQGLIKLDTETGTESKWLGKEFEFLGECVFVPKKTDSDSTEKVVGEDDGYLLSFLFNGREKSTEFVIFDAKDVSKGPVSRQALPTNIPFGLHGSYAEGLVFDPESVFRRFTACLAIDKKGWNEVDGAFSGLGLKYELEQLRR